MPQQFVHLHVHSCYSFLDGASDLESLVRRVAELGMPALALTDHNSLAAAVQFDALCRQFGIKPVFGSEVTMQDGSHLTLLARTQEGYANLCRLITIAFQRGGRLTPALPWNELAQHTTGLICLSGCRKSLVCQYIRAGNFGKASRVLEKLAWWFGRENVFAELIHDFTPGSLNLCKHLSQMAADLGVGVAATNNVHFTQTEQYAVHDVLRCIGAGITLADTKHEARPLNSAQWMKPASEMAALFEWSPEALENTVRITDLCSFELPKHAQITPKFEELPAGKTSEQYLRELAVNGVTQRYGQITHSIQERLNHELTVIHDLGFDDYFLLARKVVAWARSQEIRCSGRGSAADSIVAYALRLTDVDVMESDLPFARFLREGKTPDIDLDFQHNRRDDVFEWMKREYGADHVGLCCVFHTYWARSAMRDIGKVLALPENLLGVLRRHVSGYVAADQIADAFERHPELQHQKGLLERCQLLFSLARQIAGFPRHIGSHSSGVVISKIPVGQIAPTAPSAKGVMNIISLDKDDIETIGAVKLDVLCLRILSAVEDSIQSISKRDPRFNYDEITPDDETYQVIRAGKAMGVFQLESPAQMHLALSLKPSLYSDLTASIALIRPGPISSGTVKRFTNARNGYRKVEVLHPLLEPILRRTYGCVCFQEQVIQLISIITGWSDSDADLFRKHLSKHYKLGTLDAAKQEFIEAALTHLPDLPPHNADLLFQEIQGWAGLGFTEGHAASFAITAAKSAYLSVHHTADYFAGMMNNQPMGFWPNNSLAAEARRRGVLTKLIDINRSGDKCMVEDDEGQLAIRLGLRLVDGIGNADVASIERARKSGEFRSLLDFATRTPVSQDVVESLILCGAFDDLHEHRRGLLWRLDKTLTLARALRAEAGESHQQRLELGQSYDTPCAWELDDLSPWDKTMWEWRITGICASSHPLAWMRESLAEQGILTAADAAQQPHGSIVRVAGLNIRPHRPPKKGGGRHLFNTVEDESDILQCAYYDEDVINRCTPVILLSPAIIVTGVVKRVGPGINFEVNDAEPLVVRSLVEARLSAASTGQVLVVGR